MNYTIKSHPTMYCGVLFRSRLEARWAAFFDLAGWSWEYEPIDLEGWTPDFRVKFPCGHSECGGSHTLLVEIKPYFTLSDFDGHQCMAYPYGGIEPHCIPASASAAFGANPVVTHWEMAHGAGGGIENLSGWVDNCDDLWKRAGTIVQYNPAG
jgi:hypothetical protein